MDTLIKTSPWDQSFNWHGCFQEKQTIARAQARRHYYYYFGEINWIFASAIINALTVEAEHKKWDVKQLVQLHSSTSSSVKNTTAAIVL